MQNVNLLGRSWQVLGQESKGLFRGPSNIYGGAFSYIYLTTFVNYVCKTAPSYMFDRVIN